MEKKHYRKPVKNFFIKRELQIRLIKKIVFAVLIATIVCIATLVGIYFAKFVSAAYYRVTLDLNSSIGNRESIVSIILPSLCVSSIVNIIIAVFVGLYASRKYAVPIFKLEQWAKLLRDGHFTAKLNFREKEEMKELSDNCNLLTSELCQKFLDIKKHINELESNVNRDPEKNKETLHAIHTILEPLHLDADTIDVHTHFFHVSKIDKDKEAQS